MYLSYDLRSVQKFVFRVPFLQAIIGGSGLIAAFDDDAGTWPETHPGSAKLFTGAGHGLFSVRDAEQGDTLQAWLVAKAHEAAMEIRIGTGDTPEEALDPRFEFPYTPSASELVGHPCDLSGLYPVAPGGGKKFRDWTGVHPRLHLRVSKEGIKSADAIDLRVLREIGMEAIPPQLRGFECRFFRAVSPRADDDPDEQQEAKLGSAALGGGRRWAVICMDGNECGSQFARLRGLPDNEETQGLRKRLSQAIHAASWRALATGCEKALTAWVDRYGKQVEDARLSRAPAAPLQFLPIRPLIAGGDDIVILCHPALAFEFVMGACEGFTQASVEHNTEYARQTGRDLWAATGGRMTISAGVAFTSVTFPLHLSIPFAEELLASAKRKGTSTRTNTGSPPPACLDWDSLSEGFVDSLEARRRREYLFRDGDLEGAPEQWMTGRPYTIDTFRDEVCRSLRKMQDPPISVLADVSRAMRQGFFDRKAYVIKLRKHRKELADLLDPETQRSPDGGRWLHVLDAIGIYREHGRMGEGLAHEND